MDKVKFDPSFERQGKPLAFWLEELVADDRARRLAAGNALGGMLRGTPYHDFDLMQLDMTDGVPDLSGQQTRFQRALIDTINRPTFPTTIFVRKLMLLRLSFHKYWLDRSRRMTHHNEKLDRRETQLMEKMVTSSDETERERATKRLDWLFSASVARDCKLSAGSERSQPQGILSHMIIGWLDTALLKAIDVLYEMLEAGDSPRNDALAAIFRMGKKGLTFAPYLLRELETKSTNPHCDFASALASVGKGDPATVDRLMAFLRDGTAAQQSACMCVLADMGTELAGRQAEFIELLLAMRNEENPFRVLPALSSVGREDQRVLDILLQRAQPRPPRMKPMEGAPEYEYDEVMYERGAAIECLKHFTSFAERIIPILIDAIESFQEYDPDWGYEQGEHGRVVHVLSQFGQAASPAVPTLMNHIRDSHGALDLRIIRFFGDLGPGGVKALPLLKELTTELGSDPSRKAMKLEDPDRQLEPIDWAIWRISGQLPVN